MSKEEKQRLGNQVLEIFDNAYSNYMDLAHPADELMPLTCHGRVRGQEPSHGDMDDALGKFSLTLIDTLDTLVMLNKTKEFEEAVKKSSLILEFAALSRFTGASISEEYTQKALDFLWEKRQHSSNLVSVTINIHIEVWVRKDSGVGEGIDSYYEYLLKAYFLLGDDSFLERFNMHCDAIMKYISQPLLLLDVHIHKPMLNARTWMDSLLAFFPGLQVLKGDIRPAVETHEMLYEVIKKHNFLPKAFATDFRVHWAQHPLRPEFAESTYFLYKATGDPYYLEEGKTLIENLNKSTLWVCCNEGRLYRKL
ncbi:UNVERIFIED_CONTAM: hypothetical protein H355_008161 [Colinus virginianus]|nr:hypothetical protein H355_008161 [Colinus virginianus]